MPVEVARCGGKVGYETSGKAVSAMLMLRKGTGDRRVGVFRCPSCHLWHVGTNRRGGEFGDRVDHLRFDLHKRRRRRHRRGKREGVTRDAFAA